MPMIILSHISALEYWRASARGERIPIRQANRLLQRSEAGALALKASLPPWVDFSHPVNVLVPEKARARSSQNVQSRVWKSHLVARSLYLVSKNCAVCSPELCFMQLALGCSLPELIATGFEMCGDYSLMPGNAKGFAARPALTTQKQLSSFVSAARGCYGIAGTKRACGQIMDGSASPMETSLAMLLCLPCAMGGFGIERPILNHSISLTRQAKQIAGREHLVCDLFWPAYQVAGEYDSDAFHTGSDRIFADSKRRMALSNLGISVITVTRKQIMDARSMENAARAFAKATGKVIQRGEFDANAARWNLRSAVLPHNPRNY